MIGVLNDAGNVDVVLGVGVDGCWWCVPWKSNEGKRRFPAVSGRAKLSLRRRTHVQLQLQRNQTAQQR